MTACLMTFILSDSDVELSEAVRGMWLQTAPQELKWILLQDSSLVCFEHDNLHGPRIQGPSLTSKMVAAAMATAVVATAPVAMVMVVAKGGWRR